MNEDIITRLLREDTDKLNRAKNDIRALATERNSELLDMIAQLLDFAQTDRPVDDWKAAKAALRSFKRNY